MDKFVENDRRALNGVFTSPADIKYHGLMNQGATCYLNSVLQVLFMTKEFREAVKRHTSKNPDAECIELHLTNLFKDLEQCDPVHTYNITKKLGIDNVLEQRDAAEFFEKILSLTSREASQIFHGEFTHKNKCSVCGTETITDGPFWHLPLALVVSSSGDYSVVAGIEKFFSTSELSGENQMYCEKCDNKADATLKSSMTHHPDVLMLQLKRFEFDYNYMAYFKVNCFVDIPCTLQIPENQTYELYAVVDHFGDLRSGHYTATIKSDDNDRWYSFNDANVSMPFQVNNIEKSQSAYLLFYRKNIMDAADTQVTSEISTPGGLQLDISDNDRQNIPHINDFKQDVSDGHARNGYLNKQDDMSNTQMTDEDGKMRDEKSEKKRKSSIKYLDKNDKEYKVNVDICQNIYEDQEKQYCDLRRVGVDKQGENERIEISVKGNKEGKTGEDELASGNRTLLYVLRSEDQNNIRVSNGKQNMPKDNQGISNTLCKRHQQRREEKKGVTGEKEQETGAQRAGASHEQQHFSQGVEDQNNVGFDDRQNTPEQKISVTTRKEVGVEKQAKEQGKERRKGDNENIQNRDDSSPQQAGLAGRRRLTEKQRVGSDEKTRHVNSQSKEKSGFKEETMGVRDGTKQTKICYGKIIDEEYKITNSGFKRTIETINIRIETVEEKPQKAESCKIYFFK